MGLRWRLRVLYSRASPLLRPFWREIFQVPSKIGQKFAFLRKWGQYVKFCFRDPQKAHPCAKRRNLTYWSWKSVQGSWLLDDRKTKKTSRVTRREFSRIWGAKGGDGIFMKFCMGVGVHDVVTHANLDDDQFGGFWGSRGRISHFSIDLRCRP